MPINGVLGDNSQSLQSTVYSTVRLGVIIPVVAANDRSVEDTL